jgi:hypothetical protein
MGASNEEWGLLVEQDDEAGEVWDSYEPLPDEGENRLLDEFCARKRISIGGLARLGARMPEPGVLAFALPGGIKYRDIVTGRRWSRLGSTWDALKIVRAGTEPSPTVIVVEGETDAARLTMAYEADVAVLPAGARTVKPEYIEQLREYELVLVGTDDDEAGEVGAEKILDALPQAHRLVPPNGDWCDTPDEELPELPSETVPRRLLVFTPLADVVASEIEPAVVLHDGVLVAQSTNSIAGHPGHGKTTVVLHQVLKSAQEGQHVIWFDWENGVRSFGRRLQAVAAGLGLSREEAAELVRECFHYAPFEPLPPDEQGWAKLQEALGVNGEPPVIVFDSMSKALLHAGFDEDNNTEATKWFATLAIPAKEHGATVVVIDHVAKSATAGTGYGRGAGAKKADTDAQWYVETVVPFSRDVSGKLMLTQQKDREGVLAHKLAFTIGDGKGNLPLAPTTIDDYEEDPDAPSI